MEDRYVRAVPGGTGEAKTGGNYASSLKAGLEAKKKGFEQVLWLDGVHRRYIEEVGAMNMFFAYDDVVVTAPLTGSILNGVTRDSVLTLAGSLGFKVAERQIDIDDLMADIRAGKIKEAFGSGTAAVITPVGALCYKDECLYGGQRRRRHPDAKTLRHPYRHPVRKDRRYLRLDQETSVTRSRDDLRCGSSLCRWP